MKKHEYTEIRILTDSLSPDLAPFFQEARSDIDDGNYLDAEKIYINLLPTISKERQPSLALVEVLNMLAIINARYKGRHDIAVGYFRDAIKKATNQKNLNHTLVALYLNLGCVYYLESNWDDALEQYKTALAIALNRGENQTAIDAIKNNVNDVLTAKKHSLNTLESVSVDNLTTEEAFSVFREKAHTFMSFSEWTKAEDAIKDSIEKANQLKDLRLKALALNDFALIKSEQGNVEEALALFREAAEISQKLSDNKTYASILNNIGLILKQNNKLDDAIEAYLQSLEIKKELQPTDNISNTYYNLAMLYFEKGSYGEARKYVENAIALDRANKDPHLRDDLELLNKINQSNKK